MFSQRTRKPKKLPDYVLMAGGKRSRSVSEEASEGTLSAKERGRGRGQSVTVLEAGEPGTKRARV